MGTKMLSMLSGLLLVGCLVPGSVTVSGASDPYWDGFAYVVVSGHSHHSHCGHYYYDGGWNLYSVGHVYSQPGYARRGHSGNSKVGGNGNGHDQAGGGGNGNDKAQAKGKGKGKGNGKGKGDGD